MKKETLIGIIIGALFGSLAALAGGLFIYLNQLSDADATASFSGEQVPSITSESLPEPELPAVPDDTLTPAPIPNPTPEKNAEAEPILMPDAEPAPAPSPGELPTPEYSYREEDNIFEDIDAYGITIPIEIGMVYEDAKWLLSDFQETVGSEYGFRWHVHYNRDFQEFIMVGVDGGKIVAFYTKDFLTVYDGLYNRNSFERSFDRTPDYYYSQFPVLLSHAEDNFYSYMDGVVTVTGFFDKHDSDRVVGVLAITDSYYRNVVGWYGFNSIQNLRDMERVEFLVFNADRVRLGLHPLQWNDTLYKAALDHSIDTARTGRFSHDNARRESPNDRVNKYPNNFNSVGENIASNRRSIHSHHAFRNSWGHRLNVFRQEFTYVGIAFAHNMNGNDVNLMCTYKFAP